jgi:hypothetical protein
MPLNDTQSALLDMYQARVTAKIEQARQSRAQGKSALADRQLEQCVDIYREYALAQDGIRFQVSYLCGVAVSFAVQMGMHTKADQVLREAESLCPSDDTELKAGVTKMRGVVDQARAQKYHPLQRKAKTSKGRLH